MGTTDERPCGACGVKAGGNLRMHAKDCAVIASYCERFPGIKAFVEGKNMPQWEGRKGSRTNAKH